MMTKRGIWNIETLDVSKVLVGTAYEVLFVWSPLWEYRSEAIAGDNRTLDFALWAAAGSPLVVVITWRS